MRSSTQRTTQNDGPNMQMMAALSALEHVEDCRWRLAEILATTEARLEEITKVAPTPMDMNVAELVVHDLLDLRARILGLPEIDIIGYYERHYGDLPDESRCILGAVRFRWPEPDQPEIFRGKLAAMIEELRVASPSKGTGR